MIAAIMLRLLRIRPLAIAAATTLAAVASAQQGAQLSLATVLRAGPALIAPLPHVDWLPNGHDATVVITGDDRIARMHRLVDGAPSDEVLCLANDVYAAMGVDVRGKPVPFPSRSWIDADTLRVEFRDAVWHWRIGDERAAQVLTWPTPDGDVSGFGEPAHAIAPGDGHVAVRKDRDLWLVGKGGVIQRVTDDGSDDVVIGGAAHRAEFGIHSGMWWSADGRFLAFSREDMRPVAEYPYQDVSTTTPRLRHGRYPMAGRADSVVTIGVFDTANGALCWLEHDDAQDLYWTNVGFDASGHVYVALVDRAQQNMQLVQFDAVTGERMKVLVEEHDDEWIEPEHTPTFLADGRFLWWSRRGGYRQLWLHDVDGTRVRCVTRGETDVQSLLALSDDERHVYFQAAGDDARQLHLFAAELATGKVRQVTKERGTHEAALSPDGAMAFVTWSNLDNPPRARVVELESADVTELPIPNDPLQQFLLPKQRFFEVQTDDGTTLYGHVALPPDLQENERAPVIHYVYGGPHAQLVQDRWFGGASLWLQALACEGYVVCRLDNRGTPNRGIEFEQRVHRRLGTLEVEDQIRAIAWLKEQPFVDAERIGVHGWSFGGYMTIRLMLLHPEVYACGVSGAPVTDWRMYETGYGERYMDSPAENPEGYAASSCLPIAKELKRPLLVVHGTDDRTVMWSHTLLFVDACVEAGVDLDYFPYPMQLHGLRGKDRVHFLRKMQGYFDRHLQPAARLVIR